MLLSAVCYVLETLLLLQKSIERSFLMCEVYFQVDIYFTAAAAMDVI